jgi:hypothetical protein
MDGWTSTQLLIFGVVCLVAAAIMAIRFLMLVDDIRRGREQEEEKE